MTEPTIYELSSPGRIGVRFPTSDVPLTPLSQRLVRENLPLPELSEMDVVRHFTHLSRLNYCIDYGFYPLGSCTMKYNPRVNEDAGPFARFCLHPSSPAHRNSPGQSGFDV